MNNDQIINRLLDLLANGDASESERTLAARALVAIIAALEFVPNVEIRTTLETARDAFAADGMHSIAGLVRTALGYPQYKVTRTSFVDRLSFDTPSSDGSQ